MINKNIIEKRIKELKLTKREIIKKLNISEPQLYNWLNNKSEPSISNALNLCEILKLDIYDIIENKKKEDLYIEESKKEEILEIYNNLEEKEKNLLLALAKNIEILYNNDCVQNTEIKQARLAQLAEHLTLNKDMLEAYALLFFCEKSKKQSSILYRSTFNRSQICATCK